MSKCLVLIGLGLMALVALPLSGCAGLENIAAPTTAAQVTTLAEAEQAATLVTQAADTYVITANPSPAQLTQIQALSGAVHTALADLETANANGQSLVFASFNSALAAFNSYEAASVPPVTAATASAVSGN